MTARGRRSAPSREVEARGGPAPGGRSSRGRKRPAPILDPPEVVRTEARPAAVIRLTIPRSEMRNAMGPAVAELMRTVAAQGVRLAGPVFDRHFRTDPATFDFEVGVPVSAHVRADGRVRPGELPAGTVARTTYRGPYEGLGDAWGAFDAWIASKGLQPAEGLWQVYAAGPESGADPSAWRTELHRPLVAQPATRTRASRGAAKGDDAADARSDPAVTDLLCASKHPLRKEIEAVRRIVLGASPEIGEGVKWNAPSFRTTDWFATLNNPNAPRDRDRVRLVLHTGARAKGVVTQGKVPDPSGMLRWVAKDRCTVTFEDGRDIASRSAALQSVVRAWIRLLPPA